MRSDGYPTTISSEHSSEHTPTPCAPHHRKRLTHPHGRVAHTRPVRIRAAGSLEAYNTEYKSRMTARLKRIGLFEGIHFTKAEEEADNAGKPLLS